MNYLIIGGDGKAYGPVSGEQIRNWFREGRVDAQTRIAAEGRLEWQPMAAYAEFADLCQPVSSMPDAPPPVAAGSGKTPSSGTRQTTEPTAVASLVLGILSFMCFSVVTGIPAIICGHLARARIRQSRGASGGNAMAVIGLILGYLSLIGILFIVGAFYPIFSSARGKSLEYTCMNNLKQIGVACQMYAADFDGNFPVDLNILAAQKYLPAFNCYVCPGTKTTAAGNLEEFSRGGYCDYQYFGMNLKEGPDTNKTILIADRTGNHRDMFNIGFADGHVLRLSGKSLEEIALKNGYSLTVPVTPAAGP